MRPGRFHQHAPQMGIAGSMRGTLLNTPISAGPSRHLQMARAAEEIRLRPLKKTEREPLANPVADGIPRSIWSQRMLEGRSLLEDLGAMPDCLPLLVDRTYEGNETRPLVLEVGSEPEMLQMASSVSLGFQPISNLTA